MNSAPAFIQQDSRIIAISNDKYPHIISLCAGACGGMAQTFVGYPFDILKSKIQYASKQHRKPSSLSIFREVIKSEGMRGIYRGCSVPFVTAGVVNAVMFSSNSLAKSILAKHVCSDFSVRYPISFVICAALIASPLYCMALTPVELIKVQVQTQKEFRSPIICCQYVLQKKGFLGFYCGFCPTLLTRIVGWPFYFGVNEIVKQAVSIHVSSTINDSVVQLLAGGIGGVMFWAVNFPFDFAKTKVQGSLGQVTTLSVMKTVLIQAGIRGLYAGIGPCLLRAFPANAACFFTFSFVSRTLSGQ